MEIGIQPVTAFARFFEATAGNKVRMVRDARLFQSDPKTYIHRAYYGPFRNALRQTHWRGTDLATFQAKLDDVIAEIAAHDKKGAAAKQKRYRDLGEDYINYWKQQPGARPFEVPESIIDVAGLKIRVTAEFGVRIGSVEYALEPYFRLPPPTRLYRQATQYLVDEARQNVWAPGWTSAIYDVDRKIILPELRINKTDLRIALQGAAADFMQIWRSIEL